MPTIIKSCVATLAGVAQWIEHWPVNPKSWVADAKANAYPVTALSASRMSFK